MFVNSGHGWYLMISDLDHLVDYLNTEWARRRETVCEDNRIEYQIRIAEEIPKNEKKVMRTHPVNRMTKDLQAVASLFGYKYSTFDSYMKRQSLSLMHGMIRVLEDCGVVYVSTEGSYCSHMVGSFSDCEDRPMEVYEKEGADFPFFSEDDIRLKQWEDGEHWYAYVGDLPVLLDGKYKYDTKREAEIAAHRACSRNWRYRHERDDHAGNAGDHLAAVRKAKELSII